MNYLDSAFLIWSFDPWGRRGGILSSEVEKLEPQKGSLTS